MSRDPAQRLINWFGFLMVAVFLVSASLSCWAIWRVYLLVRALIGG